MYTPKSLLILMTLFASGALYAADIKPVSLSTSAAGNTLIFSSAPRETAEEAHKMYQPLAEYLSKATGKRVVYKYPRTYGMYRTEMVNGVYDIVFDGAHFNGYRVQKLNHNILARMPGDRTYVVFVRKGDRISAVSELAGQAVCVQPPPNLSAMILLSQFDNPQRQPLIVPVKGREAIYKGIGTGHCVAGILPSPDLKALDLEGVAKVLFESQMVADQAFSAGPRVTREDQAKLAAALLSPEGTTATGKLRAKFKGGDNFVAASNQEYAPFGQLLRPAWGFYDESVK